MSEANSRSSSVMSTGYRSIVFDDLDIELDSPMPRYRQVTIVSPRKETENISTRSSVSPKRSGPPTPVSILKTPRKSEGSASKFRVTHTNQLATRAPPAPPRTPAGQSARRRAPSEVSEMGVTPYVRRIMLEREAKEAKTLPSDPSMPLPTTEEGNTPPSRPADPPAAGRSAVDVQTPALWRHAPKINDNQEAQRPTAAQADAILRQPDLLLAENDDLAATAEVQEASLRRKPNNKAAPKEKGGSRAASKRQAPSKRTAASKRAASKSIEPQIIRRRPPREIGVHGELREIKTTCPPPKKNTKPQRRAAVRSPTPIDSESDGDERDVSDSDDKPLVAPRQTKTSHPSKSSKRRAGAQRSPTPDDSESDSYDDTPLVAPPQAKPSRPTLKKNTKLPRRAAAQRSPTPDDSESGGDTRRVLAPRQTNAPQPGKKASQARKAGEKVPRAAETQLYQAYRTQPPAEEPYNWAGYPAASVANTALVPPTAPRAGTVSALLDLAFQEKGIVPLEVGKRSGVNGMKMPLTVGTRKARFV